MGSITSDRMTAYGLVTSAGSRFWNALYTYGLRDRETVRCARVALDTREWFTSRYEFGPEVSR